MKKMYFYSLLFLFVFSFKVFARPQYAVQRNIVSCTACHYSPAGGGVKNIFGKSVASHDLGRGKFSNQDLVSADLRAMALSSIKETHNNSNGTGLMSGVISGAVPLAQYNNGSQGHMVASYDFAGFAPSSREVFARWQTASNGGLKPKHVVVGKFNIPFGLLSDSHRDYIRQQSKTSLNEFEMGAMISGNFSPSNHYDLALVQGFQEAGGIPSTGVTWGMIPNFRYMFSSFPAYVGLSGLYYKSGTKESPWAASFYTAAALSEKVTFLTEVVMADNLNDPNIMNNYLVKFVDTTLSPNYYNNLLDKRSLGGLIRLDYKLTPNFSPFIKVDLLAPDDNHLQDHYVRNGFGFRYWFNSNMEMDGVYEKTKIGREGIEETKVYSSKDRIIFTGHVWF
jgi:hypothetical protein